MAVGWFPLTDQLSRPRSLSRPSLPVSVIRPSFVPQQKSEGLGWLGKDGRFAHTGWNPNEYWLTRSHENAECICYSRRLHDVSFQEGELGWTHRLGGQKMSYRVSHPERRTASPGSFRSMGIPLRSVTSKEARLRLGTKTIEATYLGFLASGKKQPPRFSYGAAILRRSLRSRGGPGVRRSTS